MYGIRRAVSILRRSENVIIPRERCDLVRGLGVMVWRAARERILSATIHQGSKSSVLELSSAELGIATQQRPAKSLSLIWR